MWLCGDSVNLGRERCLSEALHLCTPKDSGTSREESRESDFVNHHNTHLYESLHSWDPSQEANLTRNSIIHDDARPDKSEKQKDAVDAFLPTIYTPGYALDHSGALRCKSSSISLTYGFRITTADDITPVACNHSNESMNFVRSFRRSIEWKEEPSCLSVSSFRFRSINAVRIRCAVGRADEGWYLELILCALQALEKPEVKSINLGK